METLSSSLTSSINLFCFRRCQRLLKAHDYKTVFDKTDYRASNKSALMLVRLNQGNHGRLGLVVGKKNVRRAIDRNRIKRIAREHFRLHSKTFSGFDTVIMARQGIATLDNASLRALFAQLIENAEQQKNRKQAQ